MWPLLSSLPWHLPTWEKGCHLPLCHPEVHAGILGAGGRLPCGTQPIPSEFKSGREWEFDWHLFSEEISAGQVQIDHFYVCRCLIIQPLITSRWTQNPQKQRQLKPALPHLWGGSGPCWSGNPSSLHPREPADDAGTSLIAVLCLGQIPLDLQSNDPSQSDKQDILCLCFSPSEETLLVSTSKNQLYSITMSLTEISKASLSQQRFCPDFSHLSS